MFYLIGFLEKLCISKHLSKIRSVRFQEYFIDGSPSQEVNYGNGFNAWNPLPGDLFTNERAPADFTITAAGVATIIAGQWKRPVEAIPDVKVETFQVSLWAFCQVSIRPRRGQVTNRMVIAVIISRSCWRDGRFQQYWKIRAGQRRLRAASIPFEALWLAFLPKERQWYLVSVCFEKDKDGAE